MARAPIQLFKTVGENPRSSVVRGIGRALCDDGEWLYAKHSVFYDALPHWLCEFDVYDREAACFLDTAARMALLADAPIVSVPVLYQGTAPKSLKGLQALVQASLAKSANWKTVLP